jgi:hypothetical protein
LLQDLTESSRGPVGNLRAAAETLYDYSDMSAEDRQRFLAVVRDEAAGLATRVEAAARTFAAVLKARWPLEEMLGADLLTAARRRIADRCGLQVSIEDVDAGVWLKVDGFSMLQAMTYFAARLRDEYQIRDLKLRLGRDGAMAHVDLIWSGVFMSTETVMQWELDALTLAGESSPLTVRDIVERNGGEVWFQRDHAAYRAFFRFLLPAISAQDAAVTAAGVALADSRPEFYDFDLFKSEETDLALDDRVLAQLAFTVFDTETTGLEPSAGDEIIQIGAVRIVNRRLLRHEAYEQLIDPQRSLPPASVKIHGITPEMLAGQPPIAQVLPVFRAFVADTVLVAHNAAFDMRFPGTEGSRHRHPLRPSGAGYLPAFGRAVPEPGNASPGSHRRTARRLRDGPPHGGRRCHRHGRSVSSRCCRCWPRRASAPWARRARPARRPTMPASATDVGLADAVSVNLNTTLCNLPLAAPRGAGSGAVGARGAARHRPAGRRGGGDRRWRQQGAAGHRHPARRAALHRRRGLRPGRADRQ